MFEFGPGLLNGIQVRRVGWKIQQLSAAFFDALAHAIHFVAAQVVHHHYIAGSQLRAQAAIQIGQEDFPVGGGLDGHGGDHAACAECAENRQDLPATVRCTFVNPRAALATRIEPRHLRGNTALIQKNQLVARDRTERVNELFPAFVVGFCVAFCGVE